MAAGEVVLLRKWTLLSALWPTGTVPKLIVPGETTSLPSSSSLTPEPQPDAPSARKQATATADTARQLPHPQDWLLGERWCLSSRRELGIVVQESVETMGPGEG